MKKTYLIYIIAIALLTFGYINENNQYKPKYTKLYSDKLFLDETALLRSTKGGLFSNEDLKNHITLIFFGYTSCPDFCPDTLSRIDKIFKSLSNEKINKKVQLLFVSINPKDAIDKVRRYVEFFNPTFTGVILDQKNLSNLSKRTGVYIKKIEKDNGIDFYDHTGAIFLIDEKAKVLGLYTPPLNNDDIYNDLIWLTNK